MKSVMRAKTVGGGFSAAVVVVEVEEVEPTAVEVAMVPVGDHVVRVRDTATTSAALHGSRL